MGIPYMTKKNKSLVKKMKAMKIAPKRQKKATPFSDAGAIVGQKLGSFFNIPYADAIGQWLGSGIGKIFGSGDYTMVNETPGYNVLASNKQIPKFTTNERTNIVSHREYIGDVTGSADFYNKVYSINPGNKELFPWLSTIAQNYQQYRIHGMLIEFRPLITDYAALGSPGVVAMATNYNADAPAYRSRIDMENSEYAVSVKPTANLIHAIECAPEQTSVTKLYVRSGDPVAGQDLRLYDLGNFQFATQSNPVAVLGELWVSYVVEFFKPIFNVATTDSNSYLATNGSVTSSNNEPLCPYNPLSGAGLLKLYGDLKVTQSSARSVSIDSTTIGEVYFVQLTLQGAAVTYVPCSWAVTGGTTSLMTSNATYTYPPNGTEGYVAIQFLLTVTTPGIVTLTYGTDGTLPTVRTTNLLIAKITY